MELSQQVASLQSSHSGAMEELLSVRGELRAEKTKSEVLETSKAGVRRGKEEEGREYEGEERV